MSEVRISDLVLDDEHDTIALAASLVEAARKILALPRGVLVVLDGNKAKGVLTSIQLLQAIADGRDMGETNCGSIMDVDIMEVGLDTLVAEAVKVMTERRPHAIVAVDSDGGFAGYFSPNDYREAMQMSKD